MRSAFAWVLVPVLVPLCLSSLACSLLHPGGKGDAGASDGAVAVADAAPNAPPPAAENVNQVARFPDEASLGNVTAKIADPHVAVRNSVPGGTLVATLAIGTEVVEIASHDNFVLGSFTDPKSASRTLEGWIAQAAFVAGPTPAPKGGCPAGQVMLVSEEQDFCGRVCKVEKDCPSGQSCSGKANLYAAGKPGAETDTCTIPAPGPTPTPATPTTPSSTIAGVQEPPGANGACAAKYIKASDGLCHFECNKNPLQCPPHARCTAHLTTPTTPVCEPNP